MNKNTKWNEMRASDLSKKQKKLKKIFFFNLKKNYVPFAPPYFKKKYKKNKKIKKWKK